MTTTEARFVDFGGLRIEYDARVLAPRAWTAAQSRWAAELIRTAPPGPVLELCAGAGHIGLLAVTLAPRPLVCVDNGRRGMRLPATQRGAGGHPGRRA